MEKKILKTFLLVGASAFLVALLTSPSLRSSLTIAGETPGVSCADITFGTAQFADGTAVSASSFVAHNFGGVTVSLGSATTNSYGATSSGTSATRVGSSSNAGTLVFDFSSSLVITKVKVLAFQYSSSSATCTLTSSALAEGVAQTISNSAAPDITDSSSDAGYVFTGLDGGSLTASNSLALTSSKRFNLCKIVLTLNGYSSGSTSSGSASSGTVSSSTSGASLYSAFRIAPVTSSSSSCPVYNVSASRNSYLGTQVTTISKTQDCLTYEDVALYYEAYRAFPPNYKSSSSSALSYGTAGRIVSTYTKGGTHTYDYTVKLGTFNNETSGTYYEFDIDLTGSYNNGSSITRGSGRVVIVAGGITDYGSDPVCYYTEDHYADFKEFYNFQGAWSTLFAGVYNASGSYSNTPRTTATRPSVATVTYSIA